jgi:hypothetical protein
MQDISTRTRAPADPGTHLSCAGSGSADNLGREFADRSDIFTASPVAFDFIEDRGLTIPREFI